VKGANLAIGSKREFKTYGDLARCNKRGRGSGTKNNESNTTSLTNIMKEQKRKKRYGIRGHKYQSSNKYEGEAELQAEGAKKKRERNEEKRKKNPTQAMP